MKLVKMRSFDPMDCSLPSSSVHGILQARILEWAAIPLSRGSSWPRDRTQISCIAGSFSTIWATRKPKKTSYFLMFLGDNLISQSVEEVGEDASTTLTSGCSGLSKKRRQENNSEITEETKFWSQSQGMRLVAQHRRNKQEKINIFQWDWK